MRIGHLARHPGIGGAFSGYRRRCKQARAWQYELLATSSNGDGFGARHPGSRLAGVPPVPSLPFLRRREVAGFIGSAAMNPHAAAVSGVVVSGIGHTLKSVVAACDPQGPVRAGMRLEYLLPASGDPVNLKVAEVPVEAPGADILAHGVLSAEGPGEPLAVWPGGSRDSAIGNTLPLTVSAGHIHLFDPGKGNRHV